jgi:hypothetical protein
MPDMGETGTGTDLLPPPSGWAGIGSSAAPVYMFGDGFGSRSTLIAGTIKAPSNFPITANFPGLFRQPVAGNPFVLSPDQFRQGGLSPSGSLNGPNGSVIDISQLLRSNNAFLTVTVPTGSNKIDPSSGNFQTINNLILSTSPATIQQYLTSTNHPGTTVLKVAPGGDPTLTPANTFAIGGPFLAQIPYTVSILSPTAIALNVPSPATGGVVGRTKISDDNSPIPRDRVIFDYDFFENTQLISPGVNVNRFSPGFEKTFFDQKASIEVRFPFASTLNHEITADGINDGGHEEFGDVNVTLKALLYASSAVHVSAGLGIAIPTANDINVSLPDGTKIVQIHNDAWILTPFVAYIVTPNDRLFFQNWFQIGFDVNGNGTFANPDFTGLNYVGRLGDQSLLQIDAQLGYWLYRSSASDRFLRGLAPFVELHYNSTISRENSLQAGTLTIGDPNGHLDALNLSTGFAAELRNNLSLSVGAVFPLKNHPDRTFDYQLGVHLNWFFGPTASVRNAASRVSSY